MHRTRALYLMPWLVSNVFLKPTIFFREPMTSAKRLIKGERRFYLKPMNASRAFSMTAIFSENRAEPFRVAAKRSGFYVKPAALSTAFWSGLTFFQRRHHQNIFLLFIIDSYANTQKVQKPTRANRRCRCSSQRQLAPPTYSLSSTLWKRFFPARRSSASSSAAAAVTS